jgi:hypothetical protein
MPALKPGTRYRPTYKLTDAQRNALKPNGNHVFKWKVVMAIVRQAGRPYMKFKRGPLSINELIAEWAKQDAQIVASGGPLAADYDDTDPGVYDFSELDPDLIKAAKQAEDASDGGKAKDGRTKATQAPTSQDLPTIKKPTIGIMKTDLEKWGILWKSCKISDDFFALWEPQYQANLAVEALTQDVEQDEVSGDGKTDGVESDVEPSKKTNAPKAENHQTKKPRAANKNTVDKADQAGTTPSLIVTLHTDPSKLRTLPPRPEATTAQTRPKARARATTQPNAGTRTSLRTKETHNPEFGTTVLAAPSRTEANPADQATYDDVIMEEMQEEQSPIKNVTKPARTKAVQPLKRKRKDPDEQAANKRQRAVGAQEVNWKAATSQPGADIRMTGVEDGIMSASQTPDAASVLQNSVHQLDVANPGLVRDETDKQARLQRLIDDKQVHSNKLMLGRNTVRAVPASTGTVPSANTNANGNTPGASRPKTKRTAKSRIVVNFQGKGTKSIAPAMSSETSKQPAEDARDESSVASDQLNVGQPDVEVQGTITQRNNEGTPVPDLVQPQKGTRQSPRGVKTAAKAVANTLSLKPTHSQVQAKDATPVTESVSLSQAEAPKRNLRGDVARARTQSRASSRTLSGTASQSDSSLEDDEAERPTICHMNQGAHSGKDHGPETSQHPPVTSDELSTITEERIEVEQSANTSSSKKTLSDLRTWEPYKLPIHLPSRNAFIDEDGKTVIPGLYRDPVVARNNPVRNKTDGYLEVPPWEDIESYNPATFPMPYLIQHNDMLREMARRRAREAGEPMPKAPEKKKKRYKYEG